MDDSFDRGYKPATGKYSLMYIHIDVCMYCVVQVGGCVDVVGTNEAKHNETIFVWVKTMCVT